MAEIQFDNEQEFARPAAYESEPRGMTKLIIGWGLAKDERSAQYVLVGVVVWAVLLAFLIPAFIGSSTGHKPAFLPPDATNRSMHP